MFFPIRYSAVTVFSAFFLLGFFSHVSNAQDLDQSTVIGRVVDAMGSPVVGATIKAMPTEAGTKRLSQSSTDGIFLLAELMPGTYRVKVSAVGFADWITEELSLLAGGIFRLRVSLNPSGITEEVTINSDAKNRIEFDRVTLGHSLFLKDLIEVPSASRDAMDLLFLFSGVAEESLSTRDLSEDEDSNHRTTPLEQGVASIGGGASNSNNFTIDGLDNNDDRTARERFSPPIDSLEEVQVITNQYSAEYGRASGGRVNFRTRTGTSSLSGSVGIRMRDDRLNANTWRNKQRDIERPRLRERKPSFTLGGPLGGSGIGTFFFVAYENSVLEDTTIIDTYVPVAENTRFRLPSPTSDEIACEVADEEACSGTAPTAAWISQFTERIETPDTAHSVNGRVDKRFVKNGDLSVGVQIGKRTGRRTSGDYVTRLKEAIQTRNTDSEAFNLAHNRGLGSKTVVSIKAQWSRLRPSYRSGRPDDPVILIAYRNPSTDSAQTLIAGNSTASTLQNFSDTRVESRKQMQGGVTAVIGNSIARFGADFQSIRSFTKSLSDSSGTFNFASFHQFSSGRLSRYRQNFGTDSVVGNSYVGIYGMNDMRLADNINLSFGLRYESEGAVRDRDNFGPRVGIAWDPMSNGRSVIRGGFGIFYNRVLLRTIADYVRSERSDLAFFDSNLIGNSANDARRSLILSAISMRFPSGFKSVEELRSLIQSIDCSSGPVPAFCSPTLGFADSTSSVPMRAIDEAIRIPKSLVWSAAYEIALTRNAFVEASVSSNKTRKLWRERSLNLPIMPEGYSSWTDFLIGNPYIFQNSNGNIRTYHFHLGDPRVGSSVSTSPGGTASCSSTANVTCHVNLNSFSSSATRPSTASANSGNSIGSPIGIALAAIDRFRPMTDVGDISSISSIGRADSRTISITVRSSTIERDGFSISGRGSYAIGWQKDDGLNNTSNSEIDGDFLREYSRALSDRRHRVTMLGSIGLPRYLGALRSSFSFRYGSSAPFNIGLGADRNLDGSSTDRPNYEGRHSDIRWRRPGSDFPSTLLSSFTLPPIGSRSGNLPRNAGHGPSMTIFDAALSRIFRIGEKISIRTGIESGNVLNLTGFSFGAEYINFAAFGPNATPGQLQSLENFLVPSRTFKPRDLRVTLLISFQ